MPIPLVFVRTLQADLPLPATGLERLGAAVAAWDDTDAWWVDATGRRGATFHVEDGLVILAAAPSPDGGLVVVEGRPVEDDDPIGVRATLVPAAGAPVVLDAPVPASVAFDAGGRRIAVGTEDDVRLFSADGRLQRIVATEMRAMDDPLYRSLFGNPMAAIGEGLGLSSREVQEMLDSEVILTGADAVAFSPDGAWLATSDVFAHRVIDLAIGDPVAQLGSGFGTDLRFADGRLWVFPRSGDVERYDLGTFAALDPLPGDDYGYGGDVDGGLFLVDDALHDLDGGDPFGPSRTGSELDDAVLVGGEVWVAVGGRVERWRPVEGATRIVERRQAVDDTGWSGGQLGPLVWAGGELVAPGVGGVVLAWNVDGTEAWSQQATCAEDCDPLGVVADGDRVRVLWSDGTTATASAGGLRQGRVAAARLASPTGDGWYGSDHERTGPLKGKRIRGPVREQWISAVRVAADGAVASAVGGEVWIDGRPVATLADEVSTLRWSPAGDLLVIGSRSEVVVVGRDGAERLRTPSQGYVEDAVFLDARRVLVADLTVRLFDLDAGEVAQWSFRDGYGTNTIAVAPDGRSFAVLRQWEDGDRIEVVPLP